MDKEEPMCRIIVFTFVFASLFACRADITFYSGKQINEQLKAVRRNGVNNKWYVILYRTDSQLFFPSEIVAIEKSIRENKFTLSFYIRRGNALKNHEVESDSYMQFEIARRNSTEDSIYYTQIHPVPMDTNNSYKKSQLAITEENPNYGLIQSIESIKTHLNTWDERSQLDGDAYVIEIGSGNTYVTLTLEDKLSFINGYTPLKEWMEQVLMLDEKTKKKLMYLKNQEKLIWDRIVAKADRRLLDLPEQGIDLWYYVAQTGNQKPYCIVVNKGKEAVIFLPNWIMQDGNPQHSLEEIAAKYFPMRLAPLGYTGFPAPEGFKELRLENVKVAKDGIFIDPRIGVEAGLGK
jgi:hypothetical protein